MQSVFGTILNDKINYYKFYIAFCYIPIVQTRRVQLIVPIRLIIDQIHTWDLNVQFQWNICGLQPWLIYRRIFLRLWWYQLKALPIKLSSTLRLVRITWYWLFSQSCMVLVRSEICQRCVRSTLFIVLLVYCKFNIVHSHCAGNVIMYSINQTFCKSVVYPILLLYDLKND